MADALPTGAMTDEVFTRLVQIYGAFAQGAGSLFFDPAMILRARDDYAPVLARGNEELWRRDGPLILGITRAMGQFAGHLTMEERRITIGVEDYARAREFLHSARPFCPFHTDWPEL